MPYNEFNYNNQRYNINGTYHVTSLAETITDSDNTQLADVIKTLNDSVTTADATALFMGDLNFLDFIFLDDMIQIQFSNKALSDIVRLADWLLIERNPQENAWYD